MAETHKWNKSTKTGWKKEGGKWVQYRKGKKTGVNKSNLYIGSRLVNTFKRTKRNIAAVKDLPSKSKGGGAANAATVKTESKTKKPMATWRVDSKENAKLQEQFKKGEKQTYKKAGSKQTDQHKKAESTTSGKKKITTRSRMEARNREIHGDDKIDALKEKHRKWKADRKAKTEAKKNKLKATQGKSMPSNPKGMRQEGVGKTAKDLTRHTKKKKKSFGEKLAASFD